MKEITQLAESFIKKLNQEKSFHPDYEYGFDTTPKEYFDSWYFYFKILPIKPNISIKKETFGGAPGFIISKENNDIQMVSLEFIREMDEKEKRVNHLNKILSQIGSKGWKLSTIRDLTGIKPIDILNLKEKFQFHDLTISKNRLIVIKELENLIEEDDIF